MMKRFCRGGHLGCMLQRHSVQLLTPPTPDCADTTEINLAIDYLAYLVGERDVRTEPDGTEVLLDIESGGIRCLLIRIQRDKLAGALSPRELEIARLVADGHSNKIIADILEISNWTVGTHIRRIFAKVGVCSRAAMVAKVGAMAEFIKK